MGIQNYNLASAAHAKVPWRQGFAEGATKLGRKDLADVLLQGKQACVDVIETLNEDPHFTDKHPGILFDIDGTLAADGSYLLEMPEQELAPGVLHKLLQLRAAGLRMAAVTNRSCYNVDDSPEDIRNLNLDLLVKCGGTLRDVYWIGGGPHPSHKPAPDMLLHAMEREGIDPANALYVGDSGCDKSAAEAAGIPFSWASEFFGNTSHVA
jgi:HAD superfamily hydrolase (TIGR01662 family)